MKQALTEQEEYQERLTARWMRVHRILDERGRQEAKWGPDQCRKIGDHGTLAVLVEEVGEAARCLNEKHNRKKLAEEVVQIAAVALAWLEELPE